MDCHVWDNKHPCLTLLHLVSYVLPRAARRVHPSQGYGGRSPVVPDTRSHPLASATHSLLAHSFILPDANAEEPEMTSDTQEARLKSKSAFILRKNQENMLGPTLAPGMFSRPHQVLSRQGWAYSSWTMRPQCLCSEQDHSSPQSLGPQCPLTLPPAVTLPPLHVL